MELSQRDMLFNILLDTVKKHGSGMEVGLVRAVLAEVDGEIAQKLGRMQFDIPHCASLSLLSPRKLKDAFAGAPYRRLSCTSPARQAKSSLAAS